MVRGGGGVSGKQFFYGEGVSELAKNSVFNYIFICMYTLYSTYLAWFQPFLALILFILL
jgi:hypothetical protein